MALESLDIRVRQQGARTVARDVRNIGFAASAATGQLSTTSRILRGLALASVTRRIFAFADSFTNLNNRVRIFAENQEQANATSRELVEIANRARVATDAVSLTFQRLAINQERLGLTTERTLRLTELLSKAVTVGGSSAQEASGALRQFSQGLSSDFRSAAQELNSVLEQTPGLARALADGLGTTTDQIKLLAEEGRLNSQIVIQAIESQADVIEGRFARIAPTIGQAFQVFTNSVEVFVGQVFRASDAGKAITDTLITLGRRLLLLAADEERLNEVIDTTVTALQILLGLRVASFVVSYASAIDRATAASLRFVGVRVAAAFNSIGVSALFASRSVNALQIGTLGDAVFEAAIQTRRTGGVFSRVFGGIRSLLSPITGLLSGITSRVAGLGRALVALIAANPFALLVASVIAVGAALFGLRDELVVVNGQTVQIRDIAVAAFQVLSERVLEAVGRARELGRAFAESIGGLRGFINNFISSFTTLGRLIGEVAGALVLDFQSAFQIVSEGAGNVVRAFRLAFSGDFTGAFEALFRPLPSTFESAFGQIDVGRIVQEEFGRDFLQEIADLFSGTEIGRRAAELAQERARAEAAGAQGIGAEGRGAGVRETTFLLTEQQQAVSDLIAEFDVATRVTLDFLEAQNDLQGAVEKGIITERERAALLQQLGQDRFRRLAAETDEAAAATIEYNDRVAELRAEAAGGKIGADELSAALRRQRNEFQDSLRDIRAWQEQLSATDSVLEGAREGIDSFAEGIGTVFSNVAGLTESLLGQGLDAITEFTTKGTLDFRQFALDAIAEIQKVVLRLLALYAIRAGQQAAAGEGSFLGNFFTSGTPQGPGEGGPASTETGGGSLVGIFTDLLLGGRQEVRAGEQPTGAPADPLFVTISTSSNLAEDINNPITDALNQGQDEQAARDSDQAARQEGLFTRLTTGIGDFFSGTFDSITSIFSGGFDSITGGLSSLGSLFSNGLSGLASSLTGALGSLGGLLGLGGGSGGDTTSQVLGLVGGLVGIAGGFAAGGPVTGADLGKTFLVGESGPELFSPKQTGTVVPNDQLAAMGGQPPPVNVQVVNVDDPESVPNAMSTKAGETVVMNIVKRNRGRMRQLLA